MLPTKCVFFFNQVLSNYFKEKETQLQKELGTHEAKRAITEENVSKSVKKNSRNGGEPDVVQVTGTVCFLNRIA